MHWTTDDIPDLTGRTTIVTGSNAGIGFETAAGLAAAGATVVLACRNLDKASRARAAIVDRRPRGRVEVVRLDLASQAQIRDAAAETAERFPRIDVLVNNGGVMGVPHGLTEDGFELVLGTNHFGHFAYTVRLLPTLLATPGSRVVTVSSLSHRIGRIRWDDLTGVRRYHPTSAYAQSKLANLLFAYELQRRLVRSGAGTASLAAHPGTAATDIAKDYLERYPRLMRRGARYIPTAADAARSSVRAATDPGAYGGQFYGPSGRGGAAGPPVVVRPAGRALREADQTRLWALSEELTGVEYPIGRPVSPTRRPAAPLLVQGPSPVGPAAAGPAGAPPRSVRPAAQEMS